MTDQIIVQLNPDVPPTGSDLGIVNAARKSFGRRSEWEHLTKGEVDNSGNLVEYVKLKDKDKRLLEFLARGMTADDFDAFVEEVSYISQWEDWDEGAPLTYQHFIKSLWNWRNTPTHDTPFNHGFFSFEVKAPVFVNRHLVKHEYLIMSEYSRRYITDTPEFYLPVFRMKADDIKQGSGGPVPPQEQARLEAEWVSRNLMSLEAYEEDLAEGVAPELARTNLPQSLMTSWTWSGTLGAFANMCKLRLSKDTQYETRLVAQGVYAELKKQFPISAPLLVEGVL
tara:strand:- start:2306 stop:3151 length:846 start_codon:yes stop_codon:yes gene_type:complete